MAFDRLLGEAYILMRADGSLIPKDVERIGKKGAKKYGDQWDKELKEIEQGSLLRFRRGLQQATVEIDFSKFRREFGDVEKTIEAITAKTKRLRNENALSNKQYKVVIGSLHQWADAQREADEQAKKTADTTKRLTQMFKDQNANLTLLNRSRKEEAVRVEASNRAYSTYGRNILAGNAAVIKTRKVIDRNSHFLVRAFDRVDYAGVRLSDGLGRAFGKGSRNNFLNFVGSFVGGLARLGTALITFPFKALSHIVSSFKEGFSTSIANGAGTLLSIGKGISSVFGGPGGVVALLGGLTVGALALGKFLPGVVALVSSFLGVASALIGSIGIGLTGALLAVTPAAIGAAAGLGSVFGVINAFAQDPDNEDFWKSVFEEPFKKWAKGFAPQVETFLTGFKSGFSRMFKELTPALNAFFTNWDRTINDPSTQSALDKWAVSLGRIAKSFNTGITSLASGLIGFFVPILPYAEKLATWFSTLTTRFNHWANSAKGQNSIADFMRRAWENGKKVWEIIREIGGIIGTVFDVGDKKAGGGFLDGILETVKGINENLKTAGGKEKLEEWFTNVGEIGTSVGDLAEDVGTIIKNFNDPNAQSSARDLMNSLTAMGDLAVRMSEVADAIGRIIGYVTNPALQGFMDLMGLVDSDRAKAATEQQPTRTPVSESNAGALVNPTGAFGDLTKVNKQLSDLEARKKAMKDFIVTISVDDALAKQKVKAIEDYVFHDKTIPIEGNDDLWNATKGTVAGYVFDTKTVVVDANTKPAKAAIESLKKWLANISLSKGIRVAGVNAPGGITMARGGILTSPTYTRPGVLAGEAGREAYVPLDRPLSMIDPSVRALSAIAQGLNLPKTMAGGGVVEGGGGNSIVFGEGAVQVFTQASDPDNVARSVGRTLQHALSSA